MTKKKDPPSVFPFERNYSKERVIKIYILIFTATLFFGSINSYFANDIYSSIILIANAAIASIGFIFIKLKLYNLAKSFVLILISFVIFFYDSYDGAQSGAYLFYFPLSLAIVHIFDFEKTKEKIVVAFLFLLNITLISINFLTHYTLFKSTFISDGAVKQFFIFNLSFSILCISYFIYLIVHMNISQKKLINKLTDEMLKSKTSEDNKNTNTDVLLAELQHRLKNNLSLMSSLIRLKMAQIDPKNMDVKIDETSHAIQVVADANKFVVFEEHRLIVPAEIYLQEVINSWMCFPNNRKANFKIKHATYFLSIKQAIPIALIIHEFIAVFCRLEESLSEDHYLDIDVTNIDVIHFKCSIENLLTRDENSKQMVQILADQIDAELIKISSTKYEIKYQNDLDQNSIESERIFN